jgi:DNA-binding LacI/PurR family transcriptional regulator
MKDIARRAGVSESAVSFALNDRPGVSEGTRNRVRRVAEQLGWQPNTAARALSGERSGSIGLVLARQADSFGGESFFLQLVSGIQRALSPRHTALLFQMVEDLDEECALYRRWWAEHRVDGVIVVDPRLSDPRPELLTALGLPAVVVGGMEAPGTEPDTDSDTGPGPSYPLLANVWADDAGAMASIVKHLHELGHRRIVHVAGLPGLAHTQRRIASLRSEAQRLGLPESHSITTDYSDSEGATATRRLLTAPNRPTALVYDNDVMATAGMHVAAELGLSVPQDISLVSWEDSVLCRSTHPRLTALVRDSAEFGRRSAEQLLTLLDGGPPGRVQDPQPRLEPRESTAPPGRSAPAPD